MSIDLTPSPFLLQVQLLKRLHQGLRPGQRRIADWQGGTLAVSAVPGSGKSTGMAIAAAILLAKRHLTRTKSVGGWDDETDPFEPETADIWTPRSGTVTLPFDTPDQSPGSFGTDQLTDQFKALNQSGETLLEAIRPETNGHLLLVTFTRSAVANLKTKIRQYLRELSAPAQGFMVHTLHGLALNIAMRHPQLSGLDWERLALISPTQSSRLIRASVEQWLAAHPQTYQHLLEGRQFDGEETERLRRQSVLRTEVLPELAYTVIHEAKSSGLMPEEVWALAKNMQFRNSIDAPDYYVLAIAAGLYERYQMLLQQRGFIDYDDMILAALRVLQDETVRQFWQSQIFAVFEDEAQDSSPLQTRLLEILASQPNDPNQLNLVRVGDPNQAINSTFTPARSAANTPKEK